MKVTPIPVTPFQQHCSIVVCEATRRAAVVDPGDDIERIIGAVAKQDVSVERILPTKLWPLGEDACFVPGHGPASTFGEERRTNPFVGDRVAA